MRHVQRSSGRVLVIVCLVAAGCPPVNQTVPDVVGQTQSAATELITHAGLVVGAVTHVYSDVVDVGSVVSQDPVAGTSVASGSAVALAISKGPEFVQVPSILFHAQADASDAIIAAGLTTGTTTAVYSDYIEAGNVTAQDPAPGEVVHAGTVVDTNVSVGQGASPAIEMISVPEGAFVMGRTNSGDDVYGSALEDPQHEVTLSAYEIGRYDVTNKEYCDVLNWALAQGYLKNANGAPWAGEDIVYGGGNLKALVFPAQAASQIQYSNGVFSVKSAVGLPADTVYSMDTHPVVMISWYGAVAFCNWLSEMEALTPCYDMNTGEWSLVVPPPDPGGYRLPTEAEWERAAAWDGTKHWVYGVTSDTLTGSAVCNFDNGYGSVDPLGLVTSPVGWFNGVHISPNGNIATLNSVSPIGCYDMCGNVYQWCGDWVANYTADPQLNPTGPSAEVSGRCVRGGCVSNLAFMCRSAARFAIVPTNALSALGFRVARS